jgi:peptidoglycan L-alanyl-D-glutamate endopeptidase CwlK
MYPLSKTEIAKLETCHPNIQKIVNKLTERWNICIIEGHRGKEAQNKAFAEGKSKLKFPNGKHNSLPSMAIDMIPVELNKGKENIDWNDRSRICHFAGYVISVAEFLGTPIRWGGDWDKDTELKDNSFDDLVHFELIK